MLIPNSLFSFSSSSLDLMESNIDKSTFSRVKPSSVKMSWYADFRESKVGLSWVLSRSIVLEVERAAASPSY